MGTKSFVTEHDGWLGEPFASDFGAAWGVVLIEDMFDGTSYPSLLKAAEAARALNMRYIIYTPERTHGPRIKGPRKLYIRQGIVCLEFTEYLRQREKHSDRHVIRYATEPEYKARVQAVTASWRERNLEHCNALQRELQKTYRMDPEFKAKKAEYMRAYNAEYFARNPDKIVAKREAAKARQRLTITTTNTTKEE